MSSSFFVDIVYTLWGNDMYCAFISICSSVFFSLGCLEEDVDNERQSIQHSTLESQNIRSTICTKDAERASIY